MRRRVVAPMRTLLAAAVLAGTAATGAAAQVPFTGQTLACFSSTMGGCTPNIGANFVPYGPNTVLAPNTTGRLAFTNNAFSFSVPLGTTVPFTLGWFGTVNRTSGPVFNIPNPTWFSLAVALTNPVTHTSTFLALATGQLVPHNSPLNPSVTVDFAPFSPTNNASTPWLPFNGGTYKIQVLGTSLNSDQINQPLTGLATVTPEPFTTLLFGTGLGGLALLRRRRRKNDDA